LPDADRATLARPADVARALADDIARHLAGETVAAAA
jgi:hypothetical protein